VHKELATKPALQGAWPLVTFHQQILFFHVIYTFIRQHFLKLQNLNVTNTSCHLE